MKELYEKAAGAVCKAYDTDITKVLKSNVEEHVDARHILIYILNDNGLSVAQIARLTRLTPTCVSKALNAFANRLKRQYLNAMLAVTERTMNAM